MFGLPGWGRDPFADIIARKYGRRHQPSHSRWPEPPEHSHRRPHFYRSHSSFPNPSKGFQNTRFSNLDTPSTSDFSSSEWEEEYQYSLDTSTSPSPSAHRLPHIPIPHKHYPTHAFSAPTTRRISVKLPTPTAEDLRPDEVLVLPDLIHLHIRVLDHHAHDEQVLRAAVPETMRFGDLVGHVLGDGFRARDVSAFVRQRGRWDEQDSTVRLEGLRNRGEVFREGGKVVEVKIEIGDGGGERVFGGRRGPRGGAGERVWRRKTEEERVKMCV